MVVELFEGIAADLKPGMCQHIKPNGEQCGCSIGKDYEFCIWHDPDRVEEAEAARKLGGQLGSPPPKYVQGTKIEIEGLDDVLDGIGEVISNLQALRFTPAVANSMIRALQIAANCYLERQERDEILQQIAELEEALGGQK